MQVAGTKPMDWTVGNVDYTRRIERAFADYVCETMVQQAAEQGIPNGYDGTLVDTDSCFSQMLLQFTDQYLKSHPQQEGAYLFSAEAFHDRCLPSVIAELTMKTFYEQYGLDNSLAVWPDQGPDPWPEEWGPPPSPPSVPTVESQRNIPASFFDSSCQKVKVVATVVCLCVVAIIFLVDVKTDLGGLFSEGKTRYEFNTVRAIVIGVAVVIYKLKNWITEASKTDTRVQSMNLGPPAPCLHYQCFVNPSLLQKRGLLDRQGVRIDGPATPIRSPSPVINAAVMLTSPLKSQKRIEPA